MNCLNPAAQDTIWETLFICAKHFICAKTANELYGERSFSYNGLCGMSYLKMYEQYALLVKLTTYFPYETDSRTAIL